MNEPTSSMMLDVRHVTTELVGVGAALHVMATTQQGDRVAVSLLVQSVVYRVAFVARKQRAFDVPGEFLRHVTPNDPRAAAIAGELTEAFEACSRFVIDNDLAALEATLIRLGQASCV